MAAFLGDIAFLFGIVVATAGLFTLHRAGGDPRPGLLKAAGALLLAAGIGTATCTAYYYFKYHRAGDLDHAYPVMAHAMPMMKMMHGGMKGDRPPQSAPVPDAAGDATPSAEEHESHHPDAAGGGTE